MDTNAQQFARIGFPWSDPDGQPEVPVSKASRRIRKAVPLKAKVKPEFREEGYIRRALTAEEERGAKHRQMLAQIRRLRREQTVAWRHSGEPLVQPKETAAERRQHALALASKRNLENLAAEQALAERNRTVLHAALLASFTR